MKTYFLAADFYKPGMNKFINTIVTADLNDVSLQELARRTIAESFPHLSMSALTIKVTAFNNIEI